MDNQTRINTSPVVLIVWNSNIVHLICSRFFTGYTLCTHVIKLTVMLCSYLILKKMNIHITDS